MKLRQDEEESEDEDAIRQVHLNRIGGNMKDIHDVGTIGGTISSYSVSSKSKNPLSINLKNSIYKKVSKPTDNIQQLQSIQDGITIQDGVTDYENALDDEQSLYFLS